MARSRRPIRFSKSEVEAAIDGVETKAEALKRLGLSVNAGEYKQLDVLLRYYGLAPPNSNGRAWARGKNAATSATVRKAAFQQSLPDSEVFVVNSTYTTKHLAKRLLRLGWDYKCDSCGNTGTWNGKPLTLHVDHINGNNSDHRLENLRFLCPNCHQQTDTWGNKKRPGDISPKKRGTYKISCACGGLKARNAKQCMKCLVPIRIEWPDPQVLSNMLRDVEGNVSAVARSLGVTDNTVRKHMKRHSGN